MRAEVTVNVDGMTCSSCAGTVERAVRTVSGVESCVVDLLGNKAVAKIDLSLVSKEKIVEAIENSGFDAAVVSVVELARPTKVGNFRLAGLTCASCSTTVQNAVCKLDGVKKESVKVTLLPENALQLEFDPAQVAEKDIVEMVESLGFDATHVSSTWVDAGKKVSQPGKRTLFLRIDQDAEIAAKFLRTHEAVESVELLETVGGDGKASNKRKEALILSWLFRSWGSLSQKISPKTSVADNETDIESRLLEQEESVLKVVFNDSKVGARDLRNWVASKGVESGARFGVPQVEDKMSYASNIHAADARKKEEIDAWFRAFVEAALFSVPVFLISMVFMHIPPIGHVLHQKALFGINVEELLCWILATPVQFISGARFYRESYHAIKNKVLGMSVLVALGTTAAYFYSVFVVLYNAIQSPHPRLMQSFESSAVLITFVLLGKYLETRAKANTSKAINNLAQLTPDEATLIGLRSAGTSEATLFAMEERIPLELIQKGDILLVKPGEKVPTDGVVYQGNSTADESMITGESLPVAKKPGDAVIGGTINLDGAIYLEVTLIGDDTTLAQIIRLVDEAQTSKAPIQAFADYIASRFVPVVVLISIFTLATWCVLFASGALDSVKESWPYHKDGLNDFTFSLLLSISVLVIACPCALGLATPTAVMVGTGVGARHGILIKGGEPLELASKITAVVFDKTGTLTRGSPQVDGIMLLGKRFIEYPLPMDPTLLEGFDDVTMSKPKEARDSAIRNILFFAACAEQSSEHPLAKGILLKAREYGIGGPDAKVPLETVKDFYSEAGKGIKCVIRGHNVHIGNRKCLESNQVNVTPGTFDAMEHLEEKGQTAIVVSVDGQTEAVLGLIDKAKDEAAQTVNVLQHHSKLKVYMLTGDNRRTAEGIAGDIGIPSSNIIADVLPSGKVDTIKHLQDMGEKVAFIGDGINDSPALAQADVGIAIGAGTDVAIETGGIVLMNSNLTDVIVAFDLAKTVYKRIKLNFLWALGYNTLAIPLAAGVFYPVMHMALPPFVAAFAMALSSVSVLTSSLLLNWYKPPVFESHYGRELRRGKLGIESIDVHQADGTTVLVAVQCSSMKAGGPCLCPPEACECIPCETHGNILDGNKVSESIEGVHLPGCQRQWGKTCQCGDNCQCSSETCNPKPSS